MSKLRITVPLEAEDMEALVLLAREACRAPREHLRYLLRKEVGLHRLQERAPEIERDNPTIAIEKEVTSG